MIIAGFQKLTLLDFPGHCAATVFTPGCDLRCPFCHNASLVLNTSDEYAPVEILNFLEGRKGRLTGLAITGGEPLMQSDLEAFIRAVKSLGYKVKLDTNGSYPERLKKLLDEELLDYVAMDIKNSWESYAKTIGLETAPSVADRIIEKIKMSAQMLKACNVEHEFRTTIVKELHTKDDIVSIASFIGNEKNFFLQSFADSGDILMPGCSAHSKETLAEFLDAAKQFAPNAQLRGVDL